MIKIPVIEYLITSWDILEKKHETLKGLPTKPHLHGEVFYLLFGKTFGTGRHDNLLGRNINVLNLYMRLCLDVRRMLRLSLELV